MVGQNTVKGRIQAVSESVTTTGKQRYGYKIHEIWYDGFGTPKFDKDENVELTYKDNTVGDRTFHNIIGVVSMDKPGKPKVKDTGEVKPAETNTGKVIVEQVALWLDVKRYMETKIGKEIPVDVRAVDFIVRRVSGQLYSEEKKNKGGE